MSIEKVKEYLEQFEAADRVMEFDASSATVDLAAEALHVEGARICKTLSFRNKEEGAIVVQMAGDAKVDNHKYKDTFHTKAKMIPYDEVEHWVGHAPGGVCPFGINAGVEVWLDESLRKFETVYPAAGNDHSAVKLTLPELEEVCNAQGWVDVCKEPQA